MITFPYHKNTSGDYFPIIEFVAYHKNIVIRTSALIDSGASISVFKSEVADQLKIAIEKGKRTILGGVGGRILGYIHNVKVRIARKEFICPIVFSREYTVSFNLLGREEFFKRFRIIFEESQNRLKIE